MDNSHKDVLLAGSTLENPIIRLKVLALRLGRGRTGGSTLLDLLIQLARAAGRNVLVCDGDRRNPTLASLYPPGTPGGATQPPSDEGPDSKEWLSDSISEAVQTEASLVCDMGAGDRTVQDYVRDMDLVELCLAVGREPLGLFFSGPDMDDFEHILSIWRAGYFRPQRSLLVLNEHLVPQGRTPLGAFDAIMSRPEFLELAQDGMETIMLPRLPCLDAMRQAGLGFMDAAAGRPGLKGVPLDPVRQFMVKQWIAKVLANLARVGATEWMP